MGKGDFLLPQEHIAQATVETLVIDGGTPPWLSHLCRRRHAVAA